MRLQNTVVTLCLGALLHTGYMMSVGDNTATCDLTDRYGIHNTLQGLTHISAANTDEIEHAINTLIASQSELCIQLTHTALPLPEIGHLMGCIYTDLLRLYVNDACSEENLAQCLEHCCNYSCEKNVPYIPIIDPNDKETVRYAFTQLDLPLEGAFCKIASDIQLLYQTGLCTQEQGENLIEYLERLYNMLRTPETMACREK